MNDVAVVPLEFWQDPQGDVILFFSELECSVHFGCWTDKGEPADFIGFIKFQRARAARSFAREHLPYRWALDGSRSYILHIENSEFVREHDAYRQAHYAKSRSDGRDINHYVVRGHDIYHEILAESFAVMKISRKDIKSARLRRLLDAT